MSERAANIGATVVIRITIRPGRPRQSNSVTMECGPTLDAEIGGSADAVGCGLRKVVRRGMTAVRNDMPRRAVESSSPHASAERSNTRQRRRPISTGHCRKRQRHRSCRRNRLSWSPGVARCASRTPKERAETRVGPCPHAYGGLPPFVLVEICIHVVIQ
jgi:hypothetical protein